MKLVVNMVMGTMMASFAEGLALADKAGLSQDDFIEVRLCYFSFSPVLGIFFWQKKTLKMHLDPLKRHISMPSRKQTIASMQSNNPHFLASWG